MNEYILDLFRELHNAEKERHDTLNTQLGLPTAIVTVLCGVLAYYLDKCPPDLGKDGMQTFFAVCLLAFSVAVAAAIAFMVFAIYNYQYRYLSDPRRIHDYRRQMEAWYIAIQVGDQDATAGNVEKDLRELMTEQYLECAATNRVVNSQKAKYIHFANSAIIAALVVLAISLYPFYVSIKNIDKVHKVQLVPEQRIDAMSDNQQAKPQQAAKPAPPPKPEKPQTVLLRESESFKNK